MQEIGTWTTSEGTVSATLVLDSEIDDVSAQELPGWASGALSGALGGAATGAAAGPWGALVGAAAGATIGGVAAATAPAPPKTPPPGAPSSPQSAPGGSSAPVGGARSSAIQALQQFAAAVPALIQLVAASGAPAKTGKPSELSDSDGIAEFVSEENLGIDEWTTASEDEGAWTIP
jgi:hypothetical protein